MHSNLRLIAVHVEETAPMRFAWVLSERSGARWDELQRAEKPVGTYQQAMADGLSALQALVPDLESGPRADTSHTDQAPADADDADADAGDEPPQGEASVPRRGSLFGFGPAR